MKIIFHELCWERDKQDKSDTLLDIEIYTYKPIAISWQGTWGGRNREVKVILSINNFPVPRLGHEEKPFLQPASLMLLNE